MVMRGTALAIIIGTVSDFDASVPAAADPWAAAPHPQANGLPPGVPGLPVGSTGQTPAAPAPGPRAQPAPAPPPAPGPMPTNTPGAAPTGVGAVFQGIKDFFTGNTTVGDYKGGGTVKTSTDSTGDPGKTGGEQRHDADEKAAAQSTDPKPKSWWEGMF
jgi:hypothetical protein